MDREDLEKKAKEIATKWKAYGVPYNAIYDAVIEMANWQRQNDEHLIWQISSANYEKGIEEGKQKMMKDAVEAEVEGISKSVLNGSWGYFKVEGSYKNGDKVRVIIIKEE